MQRLRRHAASDDSGLALVLVLGIMTALSLVAVAAVTFATGGVGQARETQDRSGAMGAAQAGIDDFIARLNLCDSYWQAPCAGDLGNPALTGWQELPNTDAETPAAFTYRLRETPETSSGEIKLEVTGRVDGEERTIVATLRKIGFLRYIYYTDRESIDPLAITRQYPSRYFGAEHSADLDQNGSAEQVRNVRFSGVSAEQAQRCGRYYYPTGTDTTTRGAYYESVTYEEYAPANGNSWKWQGRSGYVWRSCEIQFAGADKITGPLHTNDSILLQNGAWFADPVVGSSWPSCPDPTPTTHNCFRGASGAQPSTGTADEPGYRPAFEAPVVMPESNAELRRWADIAEGGRGCVYRGPTAVIFRGDGLLDVHSPRTASSVQGTSTCVGTGIAGPSNGVLWVDRDPDATCATGARSVLGTFPETGDLTQYSCKDGNGFIAGDVNGRYTLGTADDVVVGGDTRYANGTSVLGLVASRNVEIYHPVRCSTTPASGEDCRPDQRVNISPSSSAVSYYRDALADSVMELDAAILSVQHGFTVQNYASGAKLGTLQVTGGIYQRHRGAVGTGGSSGAGYAKDYRYDPRLLSLPPPFFLNPQDAAWGVVEFSEE